MEGDLSGAGYDTAAVFLFFIMLLGVVNNAAVIVAVAGSKKLRSVPLNLVLLNLSLSDCLISCFGTLTSLVAAARRGWIFGDTVCQCYGFAMTLTGMASIATVMAISIDRFFIIRRSVEGRNEPGLSPTRTILLVWLYAAALAVPPLFGWNRYVVEQPGLSCSLDWQADDVPGFTYIIAILTVGFFIPLTVVSVCYSWVVIMLRRHPHRSRVRTVSVMVGYTIVATIAAWTPYAVVSLLAVAGRRTGPALAVAASVLAKSSAVYNPVVYFWLNKQIREEILAKFRRRRAADGTPTSRHDSPLEGGGGIATTRV